jgi:hypothetical protein
MGKAGVKLADETVLILRQVFDTVLKANKAFNDFVKARTKGRTEAQKKKTRRKAITKLIRENDLFRNTVRGELSKFGLTKRG